MGETLRGAAGDGRGGRRAATQRLSGGALLLLTFLLVFAVACRRSEASQPAAPIEAPAPGDAARLDSGRFTVVAYVTDLPLARSLLASALANDSFPGLARPAQHVIIAVAPDVARFREWIGPAVPEWGAAVAMPTLGRIVVRGRGAGAAAGGDPRTVLRHELAHLALHEAMGDLPPRWFGEGYASYAAGEWGRDELLATNVALLFRRLPSLDALDDRLTGGAQEARGAYALAHRAVAELAALDPARGLSLFFVNWKESGRLDSAVRRSYGITLDGFEERWQRRTRLRYGVLAVVGDLTVATVFALAVMIPLAVVRRRRDRERMDRLRRVDRMLDARAAAAGTTVEVLLGIADPPPTAPDAGEPDAGEPDSGEPDSEPGDETTGAPLGRMPGATTARADRATDGAAVDGAGVNMRTGDERPSSGDAIDEHSASGTTRA